MKSERERQIPHEITYMWNLRYGTNEHIYRTETDSQTWSTDLWLSTVPEARMRWTGRSGLVYAKTMTFRMDKQ